MSIVGQISWISKIRLGSKINAGILLSRYWGASFTLYRASHLTCGSPLTFHRPATAGPTAGHLVVAGPNKAHQQLANIRLLGVTQLGAWTVSRSDVTQPSTAVDKRFHPFGGYSRAAASIQRVVLHYASWTPCFVTSSILQSCWLHTLFTSVLDDG
jgi:hypothetical protein